MTKKVTRLENDMLHEQANVCEGDLTLTIYHHWISIAEQ